MDQFFAWIVVVLPTLFALAIELINQKTRRKRYWRYSVIAFGVALSGLTWWQQSRAAKQAKVDQDEAIERTAERVAATTSTSVTGALNKQYGELIGNLYKDIGKLEGKLDSQLDVRRRELALNYMPSIDLIYAGDQLQIWNRGKTNISLWGNKYNGNDRDMSNIPYVISPTTHRYLLTDKLREHILSRLGKNGEARVPLELYITTADNTKYIMHGELWEIVKDGQITIHTQNHGFEKVDWARKSK